MQLPENVKKELRDNYQFWAGLFLHLDTLLVKHLQRSEVVDFDVFINEAEPQTLYVSVMYNSNNSYDKNRIVDQYKDYILEIAFKRFRDA